MSAAREAILGRIRARLGGARREAAAIMAEAKALTADRAAIQPDFGGLDAAARFVEKAASERVTAQVEALATLEAVPAAAARHLRAHGLAPRIAVQPAPRLRALDWSGLETPDFPEPEEAAALSLAEYGIAETGSVVFRSGPECPVLFAFFPLHHLVVLERDRILPYPEDLWSALRRAGTAQPRNVNIVTGTSGTADIEAKNIRGAHGPRVMRIFLIG